MIRMHLLLAAALALPATAATAGPCTDRITALEKTLAKSDAGSGPTQPAAPKQGQGTSKEHAATQGMNAATGEKAASPADVRAQTQGGSTAAQGGSAAGDKQANISSSLRMAKEADAKGDASGCQKAIDDAEKTIRG